METGTVTTARGVKQVLSFLGPGLMLNLLLSMLVPLFSISHTLRIWPEGGSRLEVGHSVKSNVMAVSAIIKMGTELFPLK